MPCRCEPGELLTADRAASGHRRQFHARAESRTCRGAARAPPPPTAHPRHSHALARLRKVMLACLRSLQATLQGGGEQRASIEHTADDRDLWRGLSCAFGQASTFAPTSSPPRLAEHAEVRPRRPRDQRC